MKSQLHPNKLVDEKQLDLPTIEGFVGNTPLVCLQRLPGETSNLLLAKLEGDNPAGSVKDRPAMSMIKHAQDRGEISPGDTLIEATSGNTGIALAMAAAIRGYKMILIMPDNMSVERRAVMKAFGAEIILTPAEGSMETAIDVSREMEAAGKGKVLDQFSNPDNPRAHYEGTGPEIWRDTEGKITHFVSAMGTTGTIMGVSKYLKEQNQNIQIIGVQPAEGESIPGIRRWPKEPWRLTKRRARSPSDRGGGAASASSILGASFSSAMRAACSAASVISVIPWVARPGRLTGWSGGPRGPAARAVRPAPRAGPAPSLPARRRHGRSRPGCKRRNSTRDSWCPAPPRPARPAHPQQP